MAGHSKWKNIQHRKGAQDAKRAKEFQKITKEIHVAAKSGDANVETNAALRLAIDKARAANMPKDNIERAVAKASGSQDGANYDEILYEGYAPNGIAILVYCLTDNRNRTVSSVKNIFSKKGGNLGEAGSVAYNFDRKGVLALDNSNNEYDEDEIMLIGLEAGAEDIIIENSIIIIYTQPNDFQTVKKNLEKNEIANFIKAEISMIPQNTIDLEEEAIEKVINLIDALEDDDDVQNVYTNLR